MAAGPREQEDTAPAPEMSTLDEGEVPEDLVAIARKVRDLPVGERMAAISVPLLGRPYKVDAAGEGLPPDTDPPARYDVFDCLTFVEEVLSLALPADPASAPMVRRGLRYGPDGGAVYDYRNHFMLTEWVPNNIDAGWLEDITAQLGETWLLEKDISAQTWKWWKRRKLFSLPDDRLPVGHYSMPLLSLGAAAKAVDKIPDGALILTVRADKPGVPIVVTHIGFKIPSASLPMMRHATKMGEEPRVRDDKLSWYFEHVRWYDWWPVVGINVLMPRELGPRVSRLPPVARAAG